MKSYGGLWGEITSEENLRLAWGRVRRNHAKSQEVAAIARRLDGFLEGLRAELAEGRYAPGGYRKFKIWDPKPRIISCAPVKDRVVHHALCGVIAPLMERSYVEGSYACREGKGSHAACARAQELARRHPYYLKMDVRHYFDTIDHERLKGVLYPKFREKEVRRLIGMTIDSYCTEEGKGLPIGNLTSQWFANTYLDGLDHMTAERLGARHARYMDDILAFGKTKAQCWEVHDAAVEWLEKERGLEVKGEATVVAPVTEGMPFLGLRIYPGHWRLRHNRLWRTRRKMAQREREFLAGEIGADRLWASAAAIHGSVKWFGFKRLLSGERSEEILATEENAASGSNRHNRGGSWNNNAENCTSSNRNNNNPGNENNNLGFRLFSTSERNKSNSVQPEPGESAGTKTADRGGAVSATSAQTPFAGIILKGE